MNSKHLPSPRLQEVLNHLEKGNSYGHIAAALSIAEETVVTYVKRLKKYHFNDAPEWSNPNLTTQEAWSSIAQRYFAGERDKAYAIETSEYGYRLKVAESLIWDLKDILHVQTVPELYDYFLPLYHPQDFVKIDALWSQLQSVLQWLLEEKYPLHSSWVSSAVHDHPSIQSVFA